MSREGSKVLAAKRAKNAGGSGPAASAHSQGNTVEVIRLTLLAFG